MHWALKLGLTALTIFAVRRLYRRLTTTSTPKRGTRVVITGASSGIGAAIAEEYAKHGAHLILCARREAQLKEAADKCMARGCSSVVVFPADLTVQARCEELAAFTATHWSGEVDVLCICAGIGQRGRVTEIRDPSVYESLVRTNYLAAVWTVHYFVSLLVKAHGRLLVMSSVSGRLGIPGMAGYVGSKFALQGFLESMRCEADIPVTTICPGFVNTDMPKKNIASDGQPVGDRETMHRVDAMSPEECARISVRAVTEGTRDVVLTTSGHFAIVAKEFIPSLIDRVLRKRLTRARM